MRAMLLAAMTLAASLALWPDNAVSTVGFVGFRYHGIVCEADTAVGSLLCARSDGVGYGGGLTPQAVVVATHHHVVFSRRNVGPSAPHAVLGKTLFVFNQLRCRAHSAGTVFCAREDNSGLAIAVSRSVVSVIRLSDMKQIFSRRS